MKLWWILCLIPLWFTTAEWIYRVKKVQCFNNTGGYTLTDRCETLDNGLFFNTRVLKPINVVNIDIQFFAKPADKWLSIFKVPRNDWCAAEFQNGTRMTTSIARAIVNIFKSAAPYFFKPCPWLPPINLTITNLTVRGKYLMHVPKGYYRMFWTLREADDSILFKYMEDVDIIY